MTKILTTFYLEVNVLHNLRFPRQTGKTTSFLLRLRTRHDDVTVHKSEFSRWTHLNTYLR